MTTTIDHKAFAIDGRWNITMRPQMSVPHRGTLTLDTSDGTL